MGPSSPSQIALVASLCEEAIARGGSQVSACRRFEQLERFIAAHVGAELIAGECQGASFLDQEKFLAAAMNDEFEPQPQKDKRGEAGRSVGHTPILPRRERGIALVKSAFKKITGKKSRHGMAAYDDIGISGAGLSEDEPSRSFQTAGGETFT